jgi:hypothetical protein
MMHFEIGKRIKKGEVDINSLEKFVPRWGENGEDKFVELDKIKQKKKEKGKSNKKAYLAKLAYESGDPKEFMRMRTLERLRRGNRAERLFAEIDADGNGSVDFRELKTALRRKGCKLTDIEVKDMMAMADTDGDGFISLPEFQDFLENSFDGESGFGASPPKKGGFLQRIRGVKEKEVKKNRRRSQLYDLKGLGEEFAKKAKKEKQRGAANPTRSSKKKNVFKFPSLNPMNRPLPTMGLFDS